ncbi:hypothetical protein EAE93_20740 [Photorhabdus akhurstii]|nr:hypothetical protein [Photorhabdus akhurstii]
MKPFINSLLRWQRTENREQRTENREQRTENREQRTEKLDVNCYKTASNIFFWAVFCIRRRLFRDISTIIGIIRSG